MSPTQVFSNIKIDGILVQGKQDTGAEVNVMPLNVYDQLNLKLQGKLDLRPCNDMSKLWGTANSFQLKLLAKSVSLVPMQTLSKNAFSM